MRRALATSVRCAVALCIALGATTSVSETLPGDGAMFDPPPGWRRVPMQSETPTAIFDLCDNSADDPPDLCRLRAELQIVAYTGESKPASLDAMVAGWNATKATIVSASQRLELGGHEAIESVTRGERGTHVHGQAYFDSIVVHVGDAYFGCMTIIEPQDYPVLQGIARDVCASIR